MTRSESFGFEDLLPSSDNEELLALTEPDPPAKPPPHSSELLAAQTNKRSYMMLTHRQVDLFGRAVGVASGAIARSTGAFVSRGPREFTPLYSSRPERSHHTLVNSALKTWVYPTNVAVRDYQRNITEKAILSNSLVALPTGLGKTLIAAVVMLNYYRWTADSKIVFMAPTRPLVTQQAEACYKIAGIPRDDTALFVGPAASPAVRAPIWQEKRVFFSTPQIVDHDLKSGALDPKKIVCLVFDEAHRASGLYSYVKIVQFIKRFNEEVRILALSATPGPTVEAVQNVITNLSLSHAEVRTEKSDDVIGFVQGTEIEHYSAHLNAEGLEILSLFGKVLQPLLTELNNANAYHVRDPEKITQYGLVKARSELRQMVANKGMHESQMWKSDKILAFLTTLAHSLSLLKNHGIRPFRDYIINWEKAQYASDSGKPKKLGKYASSVINTREYKEMIQKSKSYLDQGVSSHEKVDMLVATMAEYFSREDVAADQSKVIVFCEFRSSAAELLRVLSEAENVKPHIFIGQSASRDQRNEQVGQGMSQKEQQKVKNFARTATFVMLIIIFF